MEKHGVLKSTTFSIASTMCATLTLAVFGDDPHNGLLEKVDAEYLRLASDLDSGLAVFIRETIQPEGEVDWWMREFDGVQSRSRIDEVVKRIRQRMDQERRVVAAKDIELDFIGVAISSPFFTTVADGVVFKGLDAKAARVLTKSDILAGGFIVQPYAKREVPQRRHEEEGLIAMKFMSEPSQVKFDRKWVKDVVDPMEQIGKVMDRFPATAKVTIVWHVRTRTSASLRCTEIVLTGTMGAWK